MSKHESLSNTRRIIPSWVPWSVAALMSSMLFLFIFLFGDMHYAINDDGFILRSFMGFTSTQLPTFHPYLNALLVYPLNWLGTVFPGIAWFSYIQLAFLWLACTVSTKSIIRIFLRNSQSLFLGLVCAASYLLVFGITNCCEVTYTLTAGMLGAAAVLQILSIDCDDSSDRQIFNGILGALLLVVLGYSLRQITALPVLGFCAIAFLYQGLSHFGLRANKRRNWRPLLLAAVTVTVVMGTLAGLRQIEINTKGMGEYMRWQSARTSVMDYQGTQGLPDELLKKIGWTRPELDLVDRWYFLDSNITTDAFETIAAYQDSIANHDLTTRITNGITQVATLFRDEPIATRSVWLLVGISLLCIISLLLKRKASLWSWLALFATLISAAILLLYLGMAGRLPLRAAMMVILPTSALLFGLLPDCLAGSWTFSKRGVLTVLASGCMALTVWYAVPTCLSLLKVPENALDEASLTNAFADLDEYALENPDRLFIYDSTFSSDKRMFPSTDGGIPTNIMFWGGWGARSPEYIAQLTAFGFDPDHLDATIFLDEQVRLVRGTIDSPPNNLIAYLTVLCGDTFDYNYDDEWGGVHTLQFYSYE